MPAVAAFFVIAWGEGRGPLRDAGAFLFPGMLFLVGGRSTTDAVPIPAGEEDAQ